MTITADELIETFALFDDWEERYRYLIDLGARLPPMDEVLKTPASKVQGCMSQVWMVTHWDADGRLQILADSDAQIVRGLIAVVCAVFSGKTRDEVAATDIKSAFSQLGLDQHLSPNRRNGFFAMVERVQREAKAHLPT